MKEQRCSTVERIHKKRKLIVMHLGGVMVGCLAGAAGIPSSCCSDGRGRQ